MIGMVFAAGLGTRLRPLTEGLPKPVVPVFDRPLAAFSLERLAAAGVTRCAINTHHLADAVPRALAGHVPAGMDARFVHEPTLLGTGGGLRSALGPLVREAGLADDATLMVMNGDILYWPDLDRALATHRRLGAIATVVLRDDPRASTLGALELDADGRVRRLLGKPAPEGAPWGQLSMHMFTGVHVLSLRALRDLPEEGCVIRQAYRRWVDDPAITVAGVVDAAPFRDLGTPGEYHQVHLDGLRGALTWPGRAFIGDGLARVGSSALAGDAVVGEGAVVEESVLMRGARVAPGVRVTRSVVWPDTEVRADAIDCILAPHARVSVAREDQRARR